MNETIVPIEQKRTHSLLTRALLTTCVLGMGVAIATPAFSQAAPTPVDALKTETAKVSGIYNDVSPVAIGSMVFGIGAILVKRLAFA